MRELVLMLLVALSVPLVFRRPIWAMAIYLGANVVRPEMFFWGGSGGSYFFMVYYGLITVTSCFGGYLRNAGRITNREFGLMVWLFVAILVSSLFAQYQVFRGDYYIVELLKGFIICAFIYMMVGDFSDIKLLQNVMLGCFCFLGAWGIQQQFLGNERLEGLGGSAWGDSNDVAAVFILYLPVAFAKLFASENRKSYWKAVVISVIMVILVVCTKSRGGLLGIIAAVAAFGFYSRNLRKIALISLLMAVVAMPFATQEYLERMKTMESTESLDDSANSRFVLWQAGLMVLADNPLFGTGFLTYPEAKMKYQNRFLDLDQGFVQRVFRVQDKKVTHDTYIQMLSDCGLFGALPYILLIAGGISAGFRARRLMIRFPGERERLVWLCGLSAGITGFAVCIIALDSVLVPFIYVQLVFVGILSRIIAKDIETQESTVFYHNTSEGDQP